MESVYEELDEANAEIERLREQYRIKAELAESLNKSHNDQLGKYKEANSKLEKLVQELNEKEDAISTANQLIDELKSSLTMKESIIKTISSAHDKLRLECNEKLQKFDEDNRSLALALGDANAKNNDQEQQIHALKQEIEGVRRILSISKNKCSETENRAREIEMRNGICLELEEENRKFEDQLKWKKEQFAHLEEAHRKIRNEFKLKEREWEKEKSTLLDDISSLQANLGSQTRISKDLQQRLEMCNQALAHAESKRKLLEAQLSESRASLDNICAEYDEAKSIFDVLAAQKDQDIANLRSSLGTKAILYKEMEYQFRKLEQEKQDLMSSLRELQEDRIYEAGRVSSASKLQNKLKSLEQVHKGCSAYLKAKESEWNSQLEKLTEELSSCRLASETRDVYLNELKTEVETCDSLIVKLELMNQETSLMLLVLESEFSEAKLRLADNHASMDLKNKALQQNVSGLVEQLEAKKAALNLVQKDLEDERAKVVLLSERVQSLEELQFPLKKELDRLKEMLKESSMCKVQSEEQVIQIQGDLRKVHAALDRANAELYEKACEANEIEFELQIWKSIAEQLEVNLNQNLQMRREVEASLLSQMEVEVDLKQEKESLGYLLEEKEKRIDDLQHQLDEQNEQIASLGISKVSITKGESLHHAGEELIEKVGEYDENDEEINREKNDKEETTLHQLVDEKDQRIYGLQQLVSSLEQEFESSSGSFSSRLLQMQEEMNSLRESLEKIKADGILKEMEIQEKSMMVMELENDLENLQERVGHREKSLFHSENKIQQVQAELQTKEFKIHKLERELVAKTSRWDEMIKKINEEKMEMVEESMRLSSDNQALVNAMSLLSEKIKNMSMEDMQIEENLAKIANGFEEHDPVKENMISLFSSSGKNADGHVHRERSPLRTLNSR